MPIADNTLKDMALFLEDEGYQGLVDSFTPPKLELKLEDAQPFGVMSPVPIRMGYNKLEAQMVTSSHMYNTMSQVGLFSGESKVELRGALQNLDGTTTQEKINMRGFCNSFEEGEWKPSEKNSWTLQWQILFYERYINGVEAAYIDVENKIWRINGVDQLEQIRSALKQ